MTEVIDDASTLWELLERRADRSPDAPMLIDEQDRTVSFGEFKAWSERVAAGLIGLGITPDTPVAWQLPTRIESIVLSFALARLGTTQLPIIPIYREREVGSVIVQGGVRFFAVPGTWRNFDYEAMAKGLQAATGEPFEILRGRPTRSPRATRPRCRRRRPTATRCAGSTRRRAPPRRRSA